MLAFLTTQPCSSSHFSLRPKNQGHDADKENLDYVRLSFQITCTTLCSSTEWSIKVWKLKCSCPKFHTNPYLLTKAGLNWHWLPYNVEIYVFLHRNTVWYRGTVQNLLQVLCYTLYMYHITFYSSKAIEIWIHRHIWLEGVWINKQALFLQWGFFFFF